jgi:tetratricopeptide (TPR) repeat protein
VEILGQDPVVNAAPFGRALNQLGYLRNNQGRFDEAELLLRFAVQINEQIVGRDHLLGASSLTGLGVAQGGLNQLDKARASLERAAEISEKSSNEGLKLRGVALSSLG